MVRLSESGRQRIRAALAGRPGAVDTEAFIEAVAWQWSNGVGDRTAADAAVLEETAVTRVLGLVEASGGGAIAFEGGVDTLANDPVLLSAFFQNLDLLPAEHDPHIDAIALMVGAAVHRLSETLDPGPDAV